MWNEWGPGLSRPASRAASSPSKPTFYLKQLQMPRSLFSWVLWTLEDSGCLGRTTLCRISAPWPGSSSVTPALSPTGPPGPNPRGWASSPSLLPGRGTRQGFPRRGQTPSVPGYKAELSQQPPGTSQGVSRPREQVRAPPWGMFRWHPWTARTAWPRGPAFTCCPRTHTQLHLDSAHPASPSPDYPQPILLCFPFPLFQPG